MSTFLFFISFIFAFQSSQESVNRFLLNRAGQNFDEYTFTGNINRGVTQIIQDKEGLFWVGTINGVFSFDGYEAVAYQDEITDTLNLHFKGIEISSLFEDNDGNIWASSYTGSINVLKKGENEFRNFNRELNDFDFIPYSMIQDKDGYIWANSTNAILRMKYYSDLDSLEVDYRRFNNSSSLIDEKSFFRLIESSNGNIKILGDGLYLVNYSELEGIKIHQELEGNRFRDIYQNGEKQLLIADGAQLNLIDEFKNTTNNVWNTNSEKWINNIYKDRVHNLWISTGEGVYLLSGNTNEGFKTEKFYELGTVQDIYEDESGNLFFASSRGLIKLSWNFNHYKYIQFPVEFDQSYSYAYLMDSEGDYWIGAHDNLLRYDAITQNVVPVHPYGTNFLKKDRENNIWVGGKTGLFVFDHSSNELINQYPLEDTWQLSIDGRGNIWGISMYRLFRIDDQSKEPTFVENLIPNKKVRYKRILIAEDETIWAVDTDNILHELSISTDEPTYIGSYLEGDLRYFINWMEDDGLGNLWLSSNIGIYIIDKEKKEVVDYLNDEVLPVNDTFEIIKDHSGTLWLKQADVGSTAINPETKEILTLTPTWLARADDLSRYYCVNGVGTNGELFTDGRGGFFVFHPDSINKNPIPPKIILNDFQVNRISISSDIFRYSENDIEFSFSGIHLDEPNRNQFQYLLEGADDDWINAGNRRIASYLSLPPGEYTFFVKASNSDGIWSDAVELASFRITPPWWGNPFAYTLYALLIGLISYRFYQVQLTKKIAESEAERLKEVDEFKTRFFTNISHEFRTPLTVIMGLADKIQHESTPIIKRNASKLLELINQILELSKVEANQTRLKLEQFDFIEYVNYSVESLSTLASERGVGLSVKTEFDKLFVEMDKQKVDLILHNLLSNALKFTEKEGKVAVRVEKNSGNLIVAVTDTGIGIRKEALSHIFNRFFQSDLDNQRYEGTGIGLALTNELVHLMGGTIIVESELGVGSTFTVRIPCLFVEEQEVVEQKTDKLIKTAQIISSPKDAEVILLVEDNYDVRSFIKQVLSDEYKVIVAHNGEEGIKQASEEIPDIILTDVMMPYKDGFELTEELKQDVRTSHIPIIMLTAKADVESRISGLKTGAEVYLGKPFNEEELKTQIKNLINLRNSIQQRFSGEIKVKDLGNSAEDEFVKKIHSVIIKNLDDDTFGIDDVCKVLAVSRTQLHRKLKALTGKSTSIFIRDIRLVEAKNLLKTSQLTVSEIAYSVGFSDPNYFTKLYSEKFSHSPTKEREIVA